MKSLSDRETRVHQQIIGLFRHSRVKAESTSDFLFDAELFSDDTWRAFGLNKRQLIKAGAVGGAAIGASADLLTAGNTLLAGTLIGGAIGAAGGFFVGKNRPELKATMPGLLKSFGFWQRIGLAGRAMSVGPHAAANFPWVLLDRAFGTFFYIVNRSHARQGNAIIDSTKVKADMDVAGITNANWDNTKRNECEKIFIAVRKKRSPPISA